MRTRRDILREAMVHHIRGVSSNGHGIYTCHECGEQWRASERMLWWPVRFRWASKGAPRPLFSRHAYEVTGPNARIVQRSFARVIGIGPLRIIFGDGWREGGRR